MTLAAPYYAGDRVTLYGGDALAILAELPSASVDAVITDPPYSSGGQFRSDRTGGVHSKYVQTDSVSGRALAAFAGDNRDQRAYGYWCALWLAEALRVTKPGGTCLLFTDWRQLPVTTDALQSGGWVWRGIVPWAKPDARPQAGRFRAQCEYVIWGSAGGMPVRVGDPCLPGFFRALAPRGREHITQKPLSVMRELVKITPPRRYCPRPVRGCRHDRGRGGQRGPRLYRRGTDRALPAGSPRADYRRAGLLPGRRRAAGPGGDVDGILR